MENDWLAKWFKDKGYRLRFRHYRYPTIWKTNDVIFDRDGNEWRALDWLFREVGPANKEFRYFRRYGSFQFTPWCKGGKTEVDVEKLDPVTDEYELVVTGVARCNLSDNFAYRVGCRLAMADAYDKMLIKEGCTYA